MIWSLNEVDATGRKAARGAGLPWGAAEEAGRAARWLAERGLPGPEALAGLLTALDGADPAAHAPRLVDGVWQADPGPLSPLAAGAALWDRAAERAATPIRLGPCLWPVLVLPYAAWIAQARSSPFSLSWGGTHAVIDHDGTLHLGPCQPLLPRAEALALSEDGAPTAPPRPLRSEAEIAPEAAARLETLGHRTYAPATEESRASGAGAGLTDND